MAWNEPGNNRPNDPWGGGDQGPPDLDEVFKKLNDKINSLFGSGGPGDGSGAHGYCCRYRERLPAHRSAAKTGGAADGRRSYIEFCFLEWCLFFLKLGGKSDVPLGPKSSYFI